MSLARKLGAEFLGTGILVFVAVGTATEMIGFHLFGLSYAAGVAATALAFGLVLIALVYAIGPISGCHINPAVSMGFITSGRMKLTEGVAFMVAQVVGAIGGAYLLYGVMVNIPSYSKQIQGLGTDGYGKYSHLLLNQTGAFLVEAVLTFVFVTVVLFATHKAAIQGAGRRGHRHGPGGGPPHRDPAHRHLGQPGPEPRAGHRRGGSGPKPGVALHRRTAGGRHRGRPRAPGAGRPLQGRTGGGRPARSR